jgi:hypothetical protein
LTSPWVALAYLGWRFEAAIRTIAGRHSAPSRQSRLADGRVSGE